MLSIFLVVWKRSPLEGFIILLVWSVLVSLVGLVRLLGLVDLVDLVCFGWVAWFG